ncbi:MAG: DUF885 domain-containing protein [Robiginitomaculum sp.]
MKKFKKIIAWLFLILIASLIGLYIWFWGRPVGVTNYINKASIQMALDSPELLTAIGAVDNTPLDFHSGKLADYTKAQEDKTLAKLKAARAGLDKYGPEGLEGQDLLSWKITAWFFDDMLAQSEFEYSGYPIDQLSGVTVSMPSFLTDSHVIKNEKSVQRYISRLVEFGRVLGEVKTTVEDYRDHGVVAPDFVLEGAITGMRSFIEGGAPQNPLVTTMVDKLAKLDGISDEARTHYLDDIEAAVALHVIPGYQAMIATHEALLKTANHDAGIWRIPNGAAIYKAALHNNTTTDLTADEIHAIGLSEVARINLEMDAILDGQNMSEGTVAQRVQTLMTDPDQIFPNTDEGRADMIDYLMEINDDVMERAGEIFAVLPPQKLEILRIPEFSQDSAPGGYYSSPAMDGSRPGRFYINQKNTADNPKWTLPTLLYHEAAPGHHFQLSRSMMIEGVPLLRKMSPFTAYTEGWALYSERLAANDLGLYETDPLGDLGRLQAEMFRAVRLVVDTGMHHKRWTREQAITYMTAQTGMTEAEVTREIERYVVWPGQATAYKTGQLAILAMRARAETALGEDFNLKDFNEVILKDGAMPLGILDDVVDAWIASQRQ